MSCNNEDASSCLKEGKALAGSNTENESAHNASKAVDAMIALKRSRVTVESWKCSPIAAAKDKDRPNEYIDLESGFRNSPL